ncbi:class I SAM-dependent methyltransferase [Nocardia mexicana]|nr:class I SAM-dependent methyltransferase [Nocardia mexicana]
MDTVIRQTRRVGSFPFPHQFAFVLDNPIRRLLSNPGGLADRLELEGAEHVLELGPGPGYFSVEVARRLPHGRLDLFDIQPEMLDKARRNLERAGCRNTGFHAGDAGAGLPFEDSAFDVAFLVAVIGEVPDKSACLRELARVVKPGGVLAFQEIFLDPDRLSERELRDLVEGDGFEFLDARGSIWEDVVRFRRIG